MVPNCVEPACSQNTSVHTDASAWYRVAVRCDLSCTGDGAAFLRIATERATAAANGMIVVCVENAIQSDAAEGSPCTR